jgi:tetratricopeptide (TPR) repeat protein
MAKIALRVYNNEINDLIDHGQIEEAIAHCRHILQTFSKHVDTYRLLGKAYLEEQRYGDAADILQRVLSSVPEDFISQIGMSIIREDEGNLDTAIFHMERAFEVQPSNHAIQDELRRLYGRRDGLEPPKIRLTRGALARMYAHGNLYDQAIAELLAALSEDPQRYDLMVLLANMYFQADKKVEAAETCMKILEKLPYCFEANSLLVEILESSNREDNAKTYRQRWEQLDPYAVALDADTTTTDFVPDQAITVERLEWEPEAYGEQDLGGPSWASSLGVDVQDGASEGESMPDWLGSGGDDQPDPDAALFGETPSKEDVGTPDWMPSPDEGPGDFGLETTSEPSGPDGNLPTPLGEEDQTTPDWMATSSDSEKPLEESLFPSEGEPESTPDWMAVPAEETPVSSTETADGVEEIPDFMKDVGWESSTGEAEDPTPAFDDAPPAEQEGEIHQGEMPEWMQEIAPSTEEIATPTPSSPTEDPFVGDIQAGTDPDRQQSMESEETSETPEWLSEPGTETDEPLAAAEDQSGADDLIPSLDQPAGEPDEEASVPEEEDGLAWMESLAAKQGIAEEELVTSPEERVDTPPDFPQPTEDQPQPESEEEPSMEWLDQLSHEAAAEAAQSPGAGEATPDWLPSEEIDPQPEPEEPVASEEIPSEDAPAPTPTDDEGLAWMENLAAKQGIAEEKLVNHLRSGSIN